MNKIKVINMLNNKIVINLKKFNGKEIPINGNGFALLLEDELAYVRNTSTAFERGTLIIGEKSIVPEEIEIPISPNALTDDEIAKILRKANKNIQIELDKLDSIHTVERILEKAKEFDKSLKVIEMIDSKIEELRM